MNTLSPNDMLERLNWRYATKQFDASRRIDSRTWTALEESLVLSPSSYGLQPWGFVVVNTLELRRQLRTASFGQAQVEDASHLVVMCAREPYTESDIQAHVDRMAEVRGIEAAKLASFREMCVKGVLGKPGFASTWADEQVGLALGQFMALCAQMGIDTCALGGIQKDRYDELLGLRQNGLRAVVACAAGYRLDTDKYASTPKVRFPAERVVLHR